MALLVGCYSRSSDSMGYSSADFRYTTNVVVRGQIDGALKRLEVDHRLGRVRIVGTEDPMGEWSWTLTVRARNEGSAIDAVASADLRSRSTQDRLELTLSLPGTDGRWQFESELEIRLPKAIAVETENRFGATEIAGIAADIEVWAQNGSVRVKEVEGRVYAETSFASLDVRDTGPTTVKNHNGPILVEGVEGALDAETSFGSLTVEDVRGPVRLRNRNGPIELVRAASAADIATSFGRVSVRDISGNVTLVNRNAGISGSAIRGSVWAETSFGGIDISADAPSIVCRNSNGSIELQVLSGALTNLQAETSFGWLELRLPGGLKPMIEARTSFGTIESDFPIMPNPPATEAFAAGEPDVPRVRLRNRNGSIRVMRH